VKGAAARKVREAPGRRSTSSRRLSLTELSKIERNLGDTDSITPAMTYSRAVSTTMGPGCLTAVFGMGTGVASRVWSPGSRKWRRERVLRQSADAERGINAAKRSAVSTGQLRRSPALHTRPIDLVVFQEPSRLPAGDLVSEGVSRLDAFSVYPGRT
jgi:hypothetical protein